MAELEVGKLEAVRFRGRHIFVCVGKPKITFKVGEFELVHTSSGDIGIFGKPKIKILEAGKFQMFRVGGMNILLPTRTQQEEEQIARHEAGHAVAAVVLCKQFKDVTIGLRKLRDGRLIHGGVNWLPIDSFNPHLDSEERTRTICERTAIIEFAGPIAEGRKRRNLGSWHDFDWAAKMISHISRTPKENRANRKRLWGQSEKIVSDYQASIDAVSRELLTKRRLTYRGVQKIIDRAQPGRKGDR
jgi:hypothetical protein